MLQGRKLITVCNPICNNLLSHCFVLNSLLVRLPHSLWGYEWDNTPGTVTVIKTL